MKYVIHQACLLVESSPDIHSWQINVFLSQQKFETAILSVSKPVSNSLHDSGYDLLPQLKKLWQRFLVLLKLYDKPCFTVFKALYQAHFVCKCCPVNDDLCIFDCVLFLQYFVELKA